MKLETIKKHLKKHYVLYKSFYYIKNIVFSLNFLKYYLNKKSINHRRNLNIFDFKELSKNFIGYSNDLYHENSYYGNNLAIRNALRCDSTYKLLIEHGYYFGSYVPKYTFGIKNINIVTYGYSRYKHLERHFLSTESNAKETLVTTIGPYINYADSILNKDVKEKIKEEFGKILLVFPSHSIEGVIYKYDIQDFLNEIKKISKDYDSVFVCMYWKDIQDGRYTEYENKGYKIVTAGHRNDPDFLGRLKDIIDLSDMTISNTVGTHVGYCVARNKPHYLFNQFQEVEGNKVEKQFKERNSENYIRKRDEEVNEVIDAFSNISYIITEEQKRVVEKYWGKNEVKNYILSKASQNL